MESNTINMTAPAAFLSNITINATTSGVPSLSPSPMTPHIDVDADIVGDGIGDDQEGGDTVVTSICSFCPSGQPLPSVYDSKQFVNVQDDSLTCGFWENLFAEFTSPQDCDESRAVFEGTFDPTIYCHCPEAVATGLCPLCPNLISSENGVIDPLKIINDVTCGDYADLAAAATTEEFCQSILEVRGLQEVCCGMTPPPSSDVDVQDGSTTTAELDGQQQQQTQAGGDGGGSTSGGTNEEISSSATRDSSNAISSLATITLFSGVTLIPAISVMHSLC